MATLRSAFNAAQPAAAAALQRVSVAADGSEANGASGPLAISADGRYVAFASTASNLVAADGNGFRDVFVKDRLTGAVVLVSSSGGAPGNADSGGSVAISADGRFVAFSSAASNLVPDDTNALPDIFVKDLVTGSLRRVSTAADETQADGTSGGSDISADGRWVLFGSAATNLVAGDSNGIGDLFVKDLDSGAIERASTGSSGEQLEMPWFVDNARFTSVDGRFVGYWATRMSLRGNIELRKDMATGQSTELRFDHSGRTEFEPAIALRTLSADGRFEVFWTWETLLGNDRNVFLGDVYLRESATRKLHLLSISPSGFAGDGSSGPVRISGDGRWVVFQSAAADLVAGDTNQAGDVFVFDLATLFPDLVPGSIDLLGSGKADALLGSGGRDQLAGLAGDDLLAGLAGNDLLDGGGGIDVAWFAGDRSGYAISRGGDTIRIDGSDGVDTLVAVERARFDNAAVAFDIDGHAGQAYRLYQAAFARVPDPGGLGYWIDRLDGGSSLLEVAAAFIASDEFTALYGANVSDEEFVLRVCRNVLGIDPDADGCALWIAELISGRSSRAQLLVAFSESAENRAALLPSISDGIAYEPFITGTGTAGDDRLVGSSTGDLLVGGDGRDLLIGLGGNDRLDGGAGLDTAVFGAARALYTVIESGGGLVVFDNTGADGIDTLLDIERLRFADKSLAFDIAGNAGQGYRLYEAAFNRTPDIPGLSFWLGALDGGAALLDVAQAFLGSAEFQNLYGANPTDVEFITLLYQNVLNRLPDQDGYDFWLGAMANGLTRAEVLVEFSESGENQANLIGVLQQGIEYLPVV